MTLVDRAIFRAINGGPPWMAPLMRMLSTGLNKGPMKIALIVILLVMLAAGKTTRRAAALALIAFPIANGITDLIKHFFPATRPSNDPMIVVMLRIGTTENAGTASAHAANMAAVATIFIGTLGWFGVPWAILAFLVGYSRIYNGVHYPYQVGLGWLVGIVVGLVVLFVAKRVERWWIARKGKTEVIDGTPNPA
ncbi:phosphatase PAP2 family protein [bacterium]|nr:MAG: phosphatase PAP2 family protein [bacterium]